MRIYNHPSVYKPKTKRNFFFVLTACSLLAINHSSFCQTPDSAQSPFQRYFGSPVQKDSELRSQIIKKDSSRSNADTTRIKHPLHPANMKYSYSDSLYPKETLNFRVDLSRKKLKNEFTREEQVKNLVYLDDRDTRVLRKAVRSEGVTFFHYTKFDTVVTSLLIIQSLEKLYRLGYVSKRKISPEQIFNLYGIEIEEKEINRKNRLYLYEPLVKEKFIVEALESQCTQPNLPFSEQEKVRKKLNLFLLNQNR